MGNLPSNRIQFGLGGMLQFWKTVRSLSVAEIAAESERRVLSLLACDLLNWRSVGISGLVFPDRS